MLTRSRSIRTLPEIGDETLSRPEKKKPKEKSVASPHTKRGNTCTKIGDKQTKSKPFPTSTLADDRTHKKIVADTQKNLSELMRTDTVAQLNGIQTKSHDDAHKKFNRPVPTTDAASDPHTCFNAIERVLTTNYIDVQKRLKLMHPAKCTQYVVECSRQHARNAVSDEM